MCLCDNIGLVALILLGWELRASSITVLCVQAVMILSPLLFMPSLYCHSNSKNFYITCRNILHSSLTKILTMQTNVLTVHKSVRWISNMIGIPWNISSGVSYEKASCNLPQYWLIIRCSDSRLICLAVMKMINVVLPQNALFNFH